MLHVRHTPVQGHRKKCFQQLQQRVKNPNFNNWEKNMRQIEFSLSGKDDQISGNMLPSVKDLFPCQVCNCWAPVSLRSSSVLASTSPPLFSSTSLPKPSGLEIRLWDPGWMMTGWLWRSLSACPEDKVLGMMCLRNQAKRDTNNSSGRKNAVHEMFWLKLILQTVQCIVEMNCTMFKVDPVNGLEQDKLSLNTTFNTRCVESSEYYKTWMQQNG